MGNEKPQDGIRFGFLAYDRAIKFDGGEVVPVPAFADAQAWIDTYSRDGFIYPRTVWKGTASCERLANTERPAHLHPIPASHELRLPNQGGLDLRKSDAGFLLHLIAYCFGVRLQFEEWRFDSRVKIKIDTHRQPWVEEFISTCYKTWKTWSPKQQRRMTSALYMHSRVPSYQWNWERFMLQYAVVDACYRIAHELRKQKADVRHKDRIKKLCCWYGMRYDQNQIKHVVDIRNDLVHEVSWDDGQPGTTNRGEAVLLDGQLRRLTDNLVPALLGYQTDYTKSRWWTFGRCSFHPRST